MTNHVFGSKTKPLYLLLRLSMATLGDVRRSVLKDGANLYPLRLVHKAEGLGQCNKALATM
jgi:hypothetical protein